MSFLSRIFEVFRKLIPGVYLLQTDEAGVRVTLGTREKVLGPGWYFFWPLIQEILYATVTTQVVDLRGQSLISQDGHDMVIGGAIRYKITDIRKAMLEVQDFDGSLEALSLGALLSVANVTVRGGLQNTEYFGDIVLKKIREEASGWGLKIQKVYITDLGRSRNIRLLTTGSGVFSK